MAQSSKQKTLIVSGIAVLVVVAALVVGPALNNRFGNQKGMTGMGDSSASMESSTEGSLVQTDNSDYKMYAGLKGDAYDKAFLANMIVHHEGAVSMAKLALTNTNRPELKAMANDIISAQSKEITDMTQWQQQWGYPASSGENMMDHSAMGMQSDMASMSDELKDLKDTAFDKKFIELMIMHHQGAINMAAPGEKNAKHQEVKDLTKAVVSAQSKEIRQMQAWQKDWGL